MKKIIMAMYDMGIAHATFSALPLLAQKYQIIILAQTNLAYKKLSETDQLLDIPTLRIYEVNDYTFEQSFDFLQRENPDAVVTAISSLSETENKVDYNIAKAAQALKIRHLGILEAVYLSEELINQRFNFESHLYDSLIVASDLMKTQLVNLHCFPAEEIHVLPMPKYEAYEKIAKAPDLNEIEMKLRTLNQLDNQFALIFASSRNDKDTQVIQLLNELSQKISVKVLLTFHPKETLEFREKCREAICNSEFFDCREIPLLKAVTALCRGNKGLICSLKSSLLFDAAACGANAVGLLVNGPFNIEDSATLMGIAKGVGNVLALAEAIEDVKAGHFYCQKFAPYPDAATYFSDELASLL